MFRLAAVLTLAAAPAFAWDDLASMEMATNLGAVLAGGEKCGYTFEPSAVAGFIAENVPADDIGFASLLSTMTIGSGLQLDGMSDSAFMAQCTVVEQTARHFGFM